MRVMIDSNILDRIDVDDEALGELINRRDILLLVTSAQEREVAAIPDTAKRDRLLEIMAHLCRRLALTTLPELLPPPPLLPPTQLPPALLHLAADLPVKHIDAVDDGIIAAAVAAGCDLLVSEDIELLDKALSAGLRAMDWRLFLGRVVWAPRRKKKKT